MTDLAFALHKPLKIGDRVKSKTYMKGATGTVVERMDDEITGLGRYGIRLDHNNNVADFRRFELKMVR